MNKTLLVILQTWHEARLAYAKRYTFHRLGS
jgi:hypothetical protein